MRAYCLKMIGQLVILALIYMRISLFRTLGVNHHSAHAESMLPKGFSRNEPEKIHYHHPSFYFRNDGVCYDAVFHNLKLRF